jgi:uncharacterized phage-associated protein
MTSPQLNNVINWFLSKESMSPKKLQKILYYAYSWDLVLKNESPDEITHRLFPENFEAWVHGPVIDVVYRRFRDRGYMDIPQYTDEIPQFDEETEDILEQVWEEYGKYNGNQLESITHQEDPWITAREGYQPLDRCNEVISDETIFEYYIQQVEFVEE